MVNHISNDEWVHHGIISYMSLGQDGLVRPSRKWPHSITARDIGRKFYDYGVELWKWVWSHDRERISITQKELKLLGTYILIVKYSHFKNFLLNTYIFSAIITWLIFTETSGNIHNISPIWYFVSTNSCYIEPCYKDIWLYLILLNIMM